MASPNMDNCPHLECSDLQPLWETEESVHTGTVGEVRIIPTPSSLDLRVFLTPPMGTPLTPEEGQSKDG